MDIQFQPHKGVVDADQTDVLVIPVGGRDVIIPEDKDGMLADYGQDLSALVNFEWESNPGFEGKRGQTLSFSVSSAWVRKVVLLGVGNPDDIDEKAATMLGAPLYKELDNIGFEHVTVWPANGENISENLFAAHLADGLYQNTYRFDKYKAPADTAHLTVRFSTPNPVSAELSFAKLKAVTDGHFWARDLGNEPPNKLYPDAYARQIREELEPLGVKVTVLNKEDMEEMGMGAALAVAQGSQLEPRVVVMEYDRSGGAQKQPLALVGKGVTFDSGGLSLKPSGVMPDMKMDMAGSAAVAGAVKAIAGRGAPTNVVAVVGLVENMPGPNAYRPDDIIESMSGQTVEITNTDAEGRLVLADMLTFVQEKYDPHAIIDMATLTGACVAALGDDEAGIFSTHDSLSKAIKEAGEATGELCWPLPLREKFSELVQGKNADLNHAPRGKQPGAGIAAAFLGKFITGKTEWAHIDMAGPGIPKSGMASGYGVRLIDRLVKDNCESAPVMTSAPDKKPSP